MCVSCSNRSRRVIPRRTSAKRSATRPASASRRSLISKGKHVDVLYVVGDTHSNNTKRLAQIGAQQGIPACCSSTRSRISRMNSCKALRSSPSPAGPARRPI
ncbi:MAG: hypothetical protein V8T10_01035 [Merdibacter sp.]